MAWLASLALAERLEICMYKEKKRKNGRCCRRIKLSLFLVSESKLEMSEGKNLRQTVDHCEDTIVL